MPTDEEERDKVVEMSLVNRKNKFMGFYDAFFDVFWISILFGIAYVAIMVFFANYATRLILVLGTIIFIVTGILIIM